jgi:hypothetical protein
MKKLFMRVLIVCALGAIASTTQAGLSHVDDDDFDALVSQEYEITRDSDTNLDWLDIDAYVNKTWIEVDSLFGSGILAEWRHATTAEVGVFFTNLGLPTTNYPSSSSVDDAGASYVAAVLYTGTIEADGDSVPFGQTSTLKHFHAGRYDAPRYELSGLADNTRSTVWDNYDDYSEIDQGHWIVRTSPSVVVPEPSTFSMLAFGCIAIAGYTRLRRRRK